MNTSCSSRLLRQRWSRRGTEKASRPLAVEEPGAASISCHVDVAVRHLQAIGPVVLFRQEPRRPCRPAVERPKHHGLRVVNSACPDLVLSYGDDVEVQCVSRWGSDLAPGVAAVSCLPQEAAPTRDITNVLRRPEPKPFAGSPLDVPFTTTGNFFGKKEFSMKRTLTALFLSLVTAAAAAAQPVITSLSADALERSGRLRVRGLSFGVPSEGSRVEIGGIPAAFTRWSDSLIVAYVPEAAAVGRGRRASFHRGWGLE